MNEYRSENDEVTHSTLIDRVKSIICTRVFVFFVVLGILLMIITLATCYKSATIPPKRNIFMISSDGGLNTVSSKGLTSLTNLDVRKDDIKISLKEVYYDKSRISLGLAYKGIFPYANIVTRLYRQETLISDSQAGGITQQSSNLYFRDMTFTIPDHLPDKFDLKIVMQEQNGLKREFIFVVPVDRTTVNVNTEEFNLTKYYHGSGNRTVLVKKVVFTPASILVEFEYVKPIHEQEFRVKLYDSKGEQFDMNCMIGKPNSNEADNKRTYIALFNNVSEVPMEMRLEFLHPIDDIRLISMNLKLYQ